jgi:iron complex outermembrane receptor protein
MAIVRRLTLALIVGVLWTLPLGAQAPSGVVTGRVVDSASRQPIADVTVMIEGTRLGTSTRADGTFTIGGVPVGTHIVRARRIGYGSPQRSVAVVPNGTATVEFVLERRVAILEEVVTTGYGTQRRVAITGSISTIDPDAANVGVSPNVNSLIQGRAAGVYMAQNSGEPGANAQVRIRGGTSISASNEPLYVVDGVPIVTGDVDPVGMATDGTPPLPRSPLNLINPADIESISILKDASASIYGTRAANGVVLITTKKGTGTGPGIEYEFYVGRSSPQRYLELLDGDQYRTFVTEQVAIKTACLAAPPPGPGTIAERCAPVGLDVTSLAAQGTANTDWEREITRSANTINQNLSFAGGAGNTQYRASLNYMDQQGIVLANGFKRYQARVNGAHQAFSGRLRLGLNLTGSQIRNDYLTFENTGGFEGGVFINTINYNPTLPITRVDPISGETLYFEVPGQTSVRNPVALAEQLLDFGTTTLALGNMSADVDILSNLTGTVNVGVNRTDATRGQYWPRANPVGSTFSGRALQEQRDNTLTNLSTVLTYRPQFFSESHSFDILGGYEFSEYTRNEFGAEARNFLTDAFGYNRLQSGGTLLPPTSYREESRIVGFFSRLNYSLLDKYFLTASVRRDGSSRFGVGNKWAVFPAVSASWRISEEGFGKFGPVSELRLRAGWGRLGNPAVPPYASLLLLSAEAGSRYGFGDVPTTGVAPTRNPNPDLKWEETDLTNVALDYGFLDNRFTGSLEYYVKNTRDLIFEVPVPQPAVVATRLENIGSMKNTGIEFSLDALVMNRPEFNWNAGLVFSRDRNELGANTFVTTGGISGQGQSGNVAQRILPGQPLGTFYGAQFVGIDPQGRELFACTPTGATDTQCVGGQMIGPPRSSDFRIIGDANPDWILGLRSLVNWRKFDFSFLLNSQQGLDVFNNTALVYATKGNARQNKNFIASALNDGVGIGQPQVYSSRWVEDGSFIRLQNATLGYTFDQLPFLGPARGTRVYLSGDNLFLITDYTGYDPEVHTQSGLASRGIDYLHYPRARTITGGIRVAF